MWRASAVALLALAGPASASFLDSDFWCRTYGCAVVHDGQAYDIYDNWRFSNSSCCVAFGEPMISYYERAGIPLETGTLDRVDISGLGAGESNMIEIIDGSGVYAVMDDGDGVLDASDTMSAFTLASDTDLGLSGSAREYSHSFFITSRNTRFSLRALARIANSSGDFSNTVGLGDIKLTPTLSAQGQDGSWQYGARANAQNAVIVNGVDDLGDISGTPTQLFFFRNPIRRRNGDINEQVIRLDFSYALPAYDMSMGTGELDVDLNFEFYREP